MAKRMPPLEESLASELYDHFLDFVREKRAIPVEHAFWQWLIGQAKYTRAALPLWTFRYQFAKLVTAGWISVEPDTRALSPQRGIQIVVEDA